MTEREDLERRLQEIKEEERAERQARMDAVKLEWKYTILPSERKHLKCWDDTLVWYDLAGTVTNIEEAVAAGHDPHPGSMAYLFNTKTGRLVMNSGGGTVFIETFNKYPALEALTRDQVSWFLQDHPEGGDITPIVEEFKKAVNES